MNKVWQCVVAAAVGGALAFVPAVLSVRAYTAFATTETAAIAPPDTSRNFGASRAIPPRDLLDEEALSESVGAMNDDIDKGERGVVAGGDPAPAREAANEVPILRVEGDGEDPDDRTPSAGATAARAATPDDRTPSTRATATRAAAPSCTNRIVIPSLGINNCLVNRTAETITQTPNRQSGSAANISTGDSRFIYGHNSSNIFARLGEIQNGALIQVFTGHGTETYRVNLAESRKNFDYRCLSAGNVNRLAGITAYRIANCPNLLSMNSLVYGQPNTLSLMTCAGSYEQALGTNNRRHIIFADRI